MERQGSRHMQSMCKGGRSIFHDHLLHSEMQNTSQPVVTAQIEMCAGVVSDRFAPGLDEEEAVEMVAEVCRHTLPILDCVVSATDPALHSCLIPLKAQVRLSWLCKPVTLLNCRGKRYYVARSDFSNDMQTAMPRDASAPGRVHVHAQLCADNDCL